MSWNILKFLLIFVLVKKSFELKIECQYRNVATAIGPLYSCYVINLWDLEEPRLKSVNGTYHTDRSWLDVQDLEFSVQKNNQGRLKYFPSNVLEFFPNLISLFFIISDISTISAEDLQPFRDLIILLIRDSKIISIPADLFDHNEQLQYIYFSSNSLLAHVGENLLGNLDGLKQVSFTRNKCINSVANSTDSIQVLNLELPIKCPPLETTTTTSTIPPDIDFCPSSCSIEMQNIQEDLQETINELQQTVIENSEKILELEKMIKELTVRP